MNTVEIMGNIGNKPEIITGNNGEFASFSVAVNNNYTNSQGQKVENTEWIPCICFIEGIVKFIKENVISGSTVFVKGAFTTRTYNMDTVINTKTNEPHQMKKSEIRVQHIHLVTTIKKEETANEQA